ncbi:MAG: ParB N-terminal domain-containing protein [Treponema sp.]|jgi:ParB family chromosome partitioning protein|nr:ParB N-terminal domain-containing protein [Treponema sp.]
MQIFIEDVIVKKRIRKEMGDLEALAESMNRVGQLAPIVLTEKNVLLSGGRRLEAAKRLGWRTINAIVTKLPEGVSALEIEIEENKQRRDFSPEESAAAMKKLYRQQHPGFFRRLWNCIVRFFRRLFKL